MRNLRNPRHGSGPLNCRTFAHLAAPAGRFAWVAEARPGDDPDLIPLAISVCVATRDPAGLDEVLSALSRQTLPGHQWELLVLDFGGNEAASALASQRLAGRFGDRGRVVRVASSGRAWARARAAREARGSLLCFLEDYHQPAPDFLAAAVRAFTEHSGAGIIGGQVSLRWEADPVTLPELTAPAALGIACLGETSQCLAAEDGCVPGAGMCIRRDLLLGIASAPAPEVGVGQGGRAGVTDVVDHCLAVAAQRLGWQCWYVPELKIQRRVKTRCPDQSGLPASNEPKWLGPLAWLQRMAGFWR